MFLPQIMWPHASWISTEPDPVSAETLPTVRSVDDFVPDEGLDKSFLEDSLPPNTRPAMNTQPSAAGTADSDRYTKGRLQRPFFKLCDIFYYVRKCIVVSVHYPSNVWYR